MTDKCNDGIHLDELSCVVCQEPYGEGEFTPRILACGHTFCTRCLQILIKARSFCPDCRTPINFTDVETVPIVYVIKKIVQSVDELNKAKNKGTVKINEDCNISEKFSEVSLTARQSRYPSVGICTSHEAPQQFWCDTCQKWICGTCIFLEHGQSYEQDCKIVLATTQFIRLRENEILKIVTQEFAIESAGQTLSNFYTLIRKEFVNQVTEDEENCSATCQNYEPLLKDLNEKMEELKLAYKKMDEIRRKMNVHSLKQLKATSIRLCTIWGGKQFPQTCEELLYGVWTEIMSKVPNALIRAQHMTASLQMNNSQYTATLYTKCGYLVIPSLSTQNILGKYVIPFEELRKRRLGMRAFLTLSHKSKNMGTLQISVCDNPWGEHFISMCTGEKGPTYKGTKFFESGGLFTKYIAGGDYEFNSGKGGRKVSDVVDLCDGIMENGIICGDKSFSDATLAQFKIYFEVGSSPFASNPIGKVDFGVNLVRRISKDIYKEVSISECGILLPLTKDVQSHCDI